MKRLVIKVSNELEAEVRSILALYVNSKNLLVEVNPKEIAENDGVVILSDSGSETEKVVSPTLGLRRIFSEKVSEHLGIKHQKELESKHIEVSVKSLLSNLKNTIHTLVDAFLQVMGVLNKELPIQNAESKLQLKNAKETEIVNMYKLILGREPSQNDLSYLVSAPISQDQLFRRMIESEEHKDIVNGSHEVGLARAQFNQMKIENDNLKLELTDARSEISQLNGLLEQKNGLLEEAKLRCSDLEQSLFAYQSKEKEGEDNRDVIDRILDYLNRKFG